MSETSALWIHANQRYLNAALAVVRQRIVHQVQVDGSGPGDLAVAEEALAAAASELPFPSALEQLCAAFGLSPFERELLLLCAGVELEGGFAAMLGGGEARHGAATFSVALAVLAEPHWTALLPTAPLRRFRLIEVLPGDALVHSRLRISERILHYLTGVGYLDERLADVMSLCPPAEPVPPSHQGAVRHLVALLERQTVLVLSGAHTAVLQNVAAAACAEHGVRLLRMRVDRVPREPTAREELVRLWERETLLGRVALVLPLEESLAPEGRQVALDLAENAVGPLLLVSRHPVALTRRSSRLDIEDILPEERKEEWQRALGITPERMQRVLPIAAQFALDFAGLKGAAELLPPLDTLSDQQLFDTLWDICRVQARQRLDDLAQRIEPSASLDDLVLPAEQRRLLHEMVAQVRQRTQVYETWGFKSPSARGRGITALFSGPPGTGKTMAAEALARSLRLDMYRIDLSQVVSKYIGETEKNLRRVFDTAEQGGAILLFDEADALFGRRSEVRDSHDRYANIEVSYLLQRMEGYRGLAILTTNLKGGLDAAFLRRIRFVVHFPMPDAEQRAELWRRVFPSLATAPDLDPDRLACLELTGGEIHNIALNAAFLAAEAGQQVGMAHVVRAACSEYRKLERPWPRGVLE